MGLYQRVAFLSISFLVAGLFNFAISDGEVPPADPNVLSDLVVQGWQAVDIPSDKRISEALMTDASLFKQYVSKNGQRVSVYVGYYKSLQGAQYSHSPQVCYIAHGWTTSRSGKIAVNISERVLMANQLLVKKDEESELVYYWYQCRDKAFADLFKMKLALLPNRLRGLDQSNVFVRISTPIDNGGLSRAEDELRSFMKELNSAIGQRLLQG